MIEEAVELYRGLAAAGPDAFLPNLATSLNNLAVQLSGLGRREDALTATEEAVEIHRGLAAAGPDAFLPDLAMFPEQPRSAAQRAGAPRGRTHGDRRDGQDLPGVGGGRPGRVPARPRNVP